MCIYQLTFGRSLCICHPKEKIAKYVFVLAIGS